MEPYLGGKDMGKKYRKEPDLPEILALDDVNAELLYDAIIEKRGKKKRT